jgi:hypothetical protein
MRKALLMAAVTAALLASVAYGGNGARTARSHAPSAAGTLNVHAVLKMTSVTVACPPEAPPDVGECRARTGEGVVPGLGRATEIYTYIYRVGPPTCPAGTGKPLATSGRLVVEGKGEFRFALADGAECVDREPIQLIQGVSQSFTITGGTGTYDAASGSGILEKRDVMFGQGNETWTGTLAVPGLEFDLTPPTLSGARSKTVRASRRAKSARVTYKVTASDAVDGQVRVGCHPHSGARFPIGRTFVRCAATDSSGNSSGATFVAKVKRKR